MGVIDALIKNINPHTITICEHPSDVKFVQCNYGKDTIKCCLLCGSKSGTNLIIPHYFSCKYSAIHSIGPFVKGYLPCSSTSLNTDKCLVVLQREYSIIEKNCEKHIIYSFGIVSCVVLCMYNRYTTETILAHIDPNTVDPLHPFRSFAPKLCDVFIVGGDSSSKPIVHNLLKELRDNHYEITFAHLIDENINDFAFNAIDGTGYINSGMQDVMDAVRNPNTIKRVNKMMLMYMYKSPLVRIDAHSSQ